MCSIVYFPKSLFMPIYMLFRLVRKFSFRGGVYKWIDSSIMPGDSLCAGELFEATKSGVPGSSITSSDASSLSVLSALEIICSSIETCAYFFVKIT